MSNQNIMQAVSSGGGGDGSIYTWIAIGDPDWAASGFPGPGTAAHVAVAEVRGDADAPEETSFNILTYGASPSASAADNTTAIQAAIDAAEAEGGGRVICPTGTYSTNAALVIDSPNVELFGMPGFTLSLTDLDAPGVSISGSTCGCVGVSIVTAGIGVSGNNHFNVTGADCYLIDCSSTDGFRGFALTGCDRVFVSRCTITDAVEHGIAEQSATEDFLIEHCTIAGVGSDGIRCVGIRGTLLENVVLNSGDEGIELNNATDMRVIRNRISGSVGNDFIDSGSTGTHVRGTYGPTTLPGGAATIAAGAITVNETEGEFSVSNEASATYDDLTTINGGRPGQILVLRPASSIRHTIVKHSSIRLMGALDFALTSTFTRLILRCEGGTTWSEIGRHVISSAVLDVAGTTHTFTLEDCNRRDGVASTGASATEFTIDQVSSVPYPVGCLIVATQLGTGSLTIGATSTATLNGSSGTGLITLDGQYKSVVLWQRTADTWVALGAYS